MPTNAFARSFIFFAVGGALAAKCDLMQGKGLWAPKGESLHNLLLLGKL